MSERQFKKDNHFVPRSYLKRWAGKDGRVCLYRLLVSSPSVPVWKRASTRGLAFHEHLYTTIAGGSESDDLERWLDQEFEGPAEEPIQRVIEGRRLSPGDWTKLVRFLAAQDARTPARFEESYARHDRDLPGMIESSLASALRRRAELLDRGETLPTVPPGAEQSGVPFRVTVRPNADGEGGQIVGEVLNGRALWIMGIRRALTVPIKVLLQQRWTILRPPPGKQLVTSDNPVLRLSYRGPADYDLKGGWGVPGTDIMLPLGPEHLLYTEIGRAVPPRDSRMSPRLYEFVYRFTIENAYRHVIASTEAKDVPMIRPRLVDPALVSTERERWSSWHADQSNAEIEILQPLNGDTGDQANTT